VLSPPRAYILPIPANVIFLTFGWRHRGLHGDDAIWPDHPDWKVCAKPFMADDLLGVLSAILESADAASAGDVRMI
jgi:hypothetical protein